MDIKKKSPAAKVSSTMLALFITAFLFNCASESKENHIQVIINGCYTVLKRVCNDKTCRVDLQNHQIEPLVIRVTIPFLVIKGDKVCKIKNKIGDIQFNSWIFLDDEQLL